MSNTPMIPLDSVIKEEDAVILPGFMAEIEGRSVLVTAVLERTVVYEPAPGEPKQLARRTSCMVVPGDIRTGPPPAARIAARRGAEASARKAATRDAA